MRFKLATGPSSPPKTASGSDEMLLRADALFRTEQSQDLRDIVAEKIKDLRSYDVQAMDRVVAILMWGRSGSLLLSSYLDGHPDVLMFPESSGQRLYEFFEHHRALPLREKLLGYPAYELFYPQLFEGALAISKVQYYAAVQAILESYRDWPEEFLESRRAFFLFAHIAYNLALGRQPANSHPWIVYQQHVWDNEAAGRLVEDFPQTRFVHTIRDPISSCDGVFHYHLQFVERHIPIAYHALNCLTNKDLPLSGMESRTRTIRFEDLHSNPAGVLLGLTDWLGLFYQASLLDSTFNGSPYVVVRDGIAWSGPRLEQAQRRSRYLSRKDRALLFAVFYENFEDWGYPYPKMFGNPVLRCSVFAGLFLFPMKMEIAAAREVLKRMTLPSIRHGNILRAAKSLYALGFCRLKIIGLVTPAFLKRCAHRPALLQVDRPSQPLAKHTAQGSESK